MFDVAYSVFVGSAVCSVFFMVSIAHYNERNARSQSWNHSGFERPLKIYIEMLHYCFSFKHRAEIIFQETMNTCNILSHANSPQDPVLFHFSCLPVTWLQHMARKGPLSSLLEMLRYFLTWLTLISKRLYCIRSLVENTWPLLMRLSLATTCLKKTRSYYSIGRIAPQPS